MSGWWKVTIGVGWGKGLGVMHDLSMRFIVNSAPLVFKLPFNIHVLQILF